MTIDDFEMPEGPPRTGFWQFLDSLRHALRRVGPWLTVGLVIWATAFTLALPAYEWFESAIQNRYAPGSITHHLDRDFRTDHQEGLANLRNAHAASLAFFQILAILGGVFAAGGWLQVTLERRQGSDLRRFLFGGGRYWWRFLRVFLCVVLVNIGWRWVFFDEPWELYVFGAWHDMPEHTMNPSSGSFAETLESETRKHQLVWLQHGGFAIVFFLTLLWSIFTRTRLALLDDRSVIWAGACAFFMILRHPVKTLRPFVLLLLLEALVVVGLLGGATRLFDGWLVDDPARATILAMGAVGLLAVLFKEVLRGAQYHAAVRVSQELIKPTLRPDPWQTIGGPGGPQYPVGDDDGERYGVSM